jgi:hypothetical protein
MRIAGLHRRKEKADGDPTKQMEQTAMSAGVAMANRGDIWSPDT